MFLAAAGNPNADPFALRHQVAQIFESSSQLFVSADHPAVPASQLLEQASREYGCEPNNYLTFLRTVGDLYGGGPELVVLSKLFESEIAIYHVAAAPAGTNDQHSQQPLQLQGVFGKGQFSQRRHILVRQMGNEKHASILVPIVDGLEQEESQK